MPKKLEFLCCQRYLIGAIQAGDLAASSIIVDGKVNLGHRLSSQV